MTKSSEPLSQHLVLFMEPTTGPGVMYEPGYYFYDETGDLHGPFGTHEEVQQAFAHYVLSLEEKPAHGQ